MASKTPHIVQGLSRTPLLFIPRYLTNIFFKNMFKKKNSIIENLEIWNFKNPGSLTSAQAEAEAVAGDGAEAEAESIN